MSPQGSDRPTFLLLKARVPNVDPTSLIGRFVTHPARPLDNSAPSNPSVIIGQEVVEIEEEFTTDVIKNIKDAHARAAVESLVVLQAEVNHRDQADIRAKHIKTYRLQNHYRAFDMLEANESVRKDLDGPKGLFTRSRGKLYMIIGYKACGTKTSFSITHARGSNIQTKVTLPLSAISTTLPLNMADPIIKAGIDASHSQVQKFTTAGEQIFAIEYKVITQRNIFGVYSAKAETVMAHNPLTYDWKNAVYDSKIEGKFDDEDEEETAFVETPKAGAAHDRILDIADGPLVEADLEGETFLLLE